MEPLLASALIVAIATAVTILLRRVRQRREAFLAQYTFPPGIAKRVIKRYPHLTPAQVEQVFDALREFFHLCRLSRRCMVAMPSQVVDVAWHEFILFTRTYELFCRQALGRFLHHTPAEAMNSPTQAQQGIKRAWRLACFREGINPRTPDRLPRLFAIDGLLSIPDGFRYAVNCRSLSDADPVYCGSDIGCVSGCGGDSGGDSDSGDSGDGSGCGGGCGGD